MITLDDLRRSAGTQEPQATMLAAIEAIVARRGENMAEIAAALFGAYVTVVCASGNGEEVLRDAVAFLQATGLRLAREHGSRTGDAN